MNQTQRSNTRTSNRNKNSARGGKPQGQGGSSRKNSPSAGDSRGSSSSRNGSDSRGGSARPSSSRGGSSRPSSSRSGGSRNGNSSAGDARNGDSRSSKPRNGGSSYGESRGNDSRKDKSAYGDARSNKPRNSSAGYGDSRGNELRSDDPRNGNSRKNTSSAGDSRGNDSRKNTSSAADSRSNGSGAGKTYAKKSSGGRPQPNKNKGRPPRAAQNAQKKRRGDDIDPQRFVNEAVVQETVEAYVPTNAFTDFDLCPELQKSIVERGYHTPTQIQDVAIGPALEGRDIIGLANTGTGKTAAFVLPIIERLREDNDGATALIMAPTRELAVQINEDWMSFARSLKMRSAICVGGVNIGRQIDSLSRKPRVVIGTPGRLKDLLQNGHLRLRKTEIVVLDEADRMLDMGFINDIRVLLRALPEQRQSLCFSATITPGIKDLLDDMLVDPFTASVRTNVTNNHIEQQVVQAVSKDDKLNQLANMLLQDEFEKVIVFGRTKHGVQKLSDKLNKRGLKTEAIHGNKSQNQRQRSLQAFKNNQAQALIATDVASRGLDIPEVSHVINFDQPETYDDYIHRIGRTGRAGNGGTAITFVEVA